MLQFKFLGAVSPNPHVGEGLQPIPEPNPLGTPVGPALRTFRALLGASMVPQCLFAVTPLGMWQPNTQ